MSDTFSDKFKMITVTVCGAGYAPFASGTWGSAASLVPFVVVWAVMRMFDAAWARPVTEIIIAIGVLKCCVYSVWFGEWAIARYGRKDPKQFVLDEFAGQWVALFWLPVALGGGWTAFAIVLAGQFFLFRLFDVIKPPPARQLEALPAGWGILLDDLFAGLYANIVGQIVWRLTPAAAWLATTAN